MAGLVKEDGLNLVKEPVQERFNLIKISWTGMKRITAFGVFLILLLIGIGISLNEGTVVSASGVSGILDHDTTWTQAGGPYTLTGPLAVNAGVTLTIQSGTVVNINSYYIQVNGTLTAIGTGTNKVQFSGGEINFKPVSTGWSQQSYSGSQFQYATFQSTKITSSVPLKVVHCESNAELSIGGNSLITDNALSKLTAAGACTIQRNTMSGTAEITGNTQSTVSDNTITAAANTPALKITGGSSTITNNKLTGGGIITVPPFRGETIVYAIEIYQGTAQILNNNIVGGVLAGNSTTISNNLVTERIQITDGSPKVLGNSFIGYGGISVGYSKNSPVESPVIFNNTVSGISVYAGSVQIQANTLRGTGLNLGIGFNQEYQNGNSLVANNYIYNCCYGLACWSEGGNPTVTFQRNYVVDCEYGMTLTGGQISIENNTIRNSVFGIYLGEKAAVSKIAYNNIENNTLRGNLYVEDLTAPINAVNNWWGSTDEAAIGQTIHDYKSDFNLAKVTYVPFLNAENTQAMPDQAAALPVTQPTTNPTNTAAPTEQPVSDPTATAAPSDQPGTSASPTQHPTATVPSEAKMEGGLSSTELVIAVLAVAVIILAAAVAVLWRRLPSKPAVDVNN